MKLIRRVMIVLGVGALLLLGILGYGYWRAHGSPAWYRPAAQPDAAQVADAADRLQHKVETAHSWTALAQNQQQHPHATPQSLLGATTRPGVLDPLQMTLSEDELNAFYQRWDGEYQWSQKSANYMSNPQVVIREGRLILAATATELNVVVSLHFEPTIENGLLRLRMSKVMAGNLPLPSGVWAGYRDRLSGEMLKRLPTMQQSARLKPDGSANDEMVQVVLMKLLLHVMRDEPADPVLFLPYLQNFKEHTLPVKLVEAHIDDASESLTMQFEPLNDAERAALIASVQVMPTFAAGAN